MGATVDGSVHRIVVCPQCERLWLRMRLCIRCFSDAVPCLARQMAIANLNKWIFHRYDFRYPALLTSLHMLFCYLLSSIALRLRAKQMRPISQRARHAIWQLSAVFVVSVTAGNGALGFIHVSFAQAIGATAPLWTVALSVLLTRKSYSPQVYVSLLLISAGMVLTTRGEVNFHPLGFALIVLATLTRALKSIMQGMLLSSAEDRIDSIELLHQMSWRSALWLACWCLAMERDALHDHTLRDASLWGFLVASSLVAFFLNIAQFLVTKATSAVTLQVLGNIKVVMLILLSVAIFGNEVSTPTAAAPHAQMRLLGRQAYETRSDCVTHTCFSGNGMYTGLREKRTALSSVAFAPLSVSTVHTQVTSAARANGSSVLWCCSSQVSTMAACGCALCLSGVVLYNSVTRKGVAPHGNVKAVDEGPRRRPMRSA